MRPRTIATAFALVALACDSSGPAMSHVRLLLTDAPGPDVQSAVVYVSRAYLVPGDDGNPVDLSTTPQQHDLLQLQNGVTALLGSATIPAGDYSQLRLVVDSARLTLVDGATFDDGSITRAMRVPSGAESGIKVSFPGQLHLPAGSATLTVDISVADNFVFQGPPSGPYGVHFTPHLKGTTQTAP